MVALNCVVKCIQKPEPGARVLPGGDQAVAHGGEGQLGAPHVRAPGASCSSTSTATARTTPTEAAIR